MEEEGKGEPEITEWIAAVTANLPPVCSQSHTAPPPPNPAPETEHIPALGSEEAGLCVMASARRNLRNDLLVAADSITNTMSSLVKELKS
ncbi:hypothetical protein AB205_0140240, partial [Aquarana catesbeiana]